MRESWKVVPNLLSGARLALVVPLWVLAVRGEMTGVAWGLLAAGLTDVLDGPLARRLQVTSRFGAQLDSLADNLLAVSGAAWLVMLRPDVVEALRTPLYVWLCSYGLFLLVGWIKFHRVGNLHLWSAKAAAVLHYVFVLHCFLFAGVPVVLFGTTFVLSMISLLEGLVYQLVSPRVDEHAGSLLRVLRARRLGRSPAPARVTGERAA